MPTPKKIVRNDGNRLADRTEIVLIEKNTHTPVNEFFIIVIFFSSRRQRRDFYSWRSGGSGVWRRFRLFRNTTRSVYLYVLYLSSFSPSETTNSVVTIRNTNDSHVRLFFFFFLLFVSSCCCCKNRGKSCSCCTWPSGRYRGTCRRC